MNKLTYILTSREAVHNRKFMSTVLNKVADQIKPWHEIPGPYSLPIIGQLLYFLPRGWLYKRTMTFQESLYKNYGPIVRLDGNLAFAPTTFIFDPEASMALFHKEDPLPVRPGFESLEYHRKHFYKKREDDPAGLLFEHDEVWRKLRTKVNPIMMQPKTIKQYSNVMEEVASDMVERIKSKRNKKNMVEDNFSTELNLWALESAGVVVFGERLNCLDLNLTEDSPAMKLLNIVHEMFNTLHALDFKPSLWKYIATPAFTKGMKVYDEQLRLNEYFIDKAIEKVKRKNNAANDKNKSVLEKLLEIDRDVAVAMANDMLIAGIDTVAGTVLGALYLLAKNPDKQSKLRDEVMLKDGKRSYLKACIKESMRLFPIAAGNIRRTTKEHVVLGYRIPKNMTVYVGNHYMCSMEKQFPRPTEFIPERWIVEKNDPLYYGKAHPFSAAPFGFGVRSCIGRRFAEMEMETLLTKMVQNFKLEWIGPQPKRIRSSVIYLFKGPYNFVFTDV